MCPIRCNIGMFTFVGMKNSLVRVIARLFREWWATSFSLPLRPIRVLSSPSIATGVSERVCWLPFCPHRWMFPGLPQWPNDDRSFKELVSRRNWFFWLLYNSPRQKVGRLWGVWGFVWWISEVSSAGCLPIALAGLLSEFHGIVISPVVVEYDLSCPSLARSSQLRNGQSTRMGNQRGADHSRLSF